MSHIWLTLNNAFSPTTAVGEADIVSCVSASGCHSSGPKGASPGQKALLHGISKIQAVYLLRLSFLWWPIVWYGKFLLNVIVSDQTLCGLITIWFCIAGEKRHPLWWDLLPSWDLCPAGFICRPGQVWWLPERGSHSRLPILRQTPPREGHATAQAFKRRVGRQVRCRQPLKTNLRVEGASFRPISIF